MSQLYPQPVVESGLTPLWDFRRERKTVVPRNPMRPTRRINEPRAPWVQMELRLAYGAVGDPIDSTPSVWFKWNSHLGQVFPGASYTPRGHHYPIVCDAEKIFGLYNPDWVRDEVTCEQVFYALRMWTAEETHGAVAAYRRPQKATSRRSIGRSPRAAYAMYPIKSWWSTNLLRELYGAATRGHYPPPDDWSDAATAAAADTLEEVYPGHPLARYLSGSVRLDRLRLNPYGSERLPERPDR